MARRIGGLGRGLDALFADAEPVLQRGDSEEIQKSEADRLDSAADAVNLDEGNFENRVIYIDIDDIKPNADQPRKNFDEEKLQDLANSIQANGVIQPLIVRRAGETFELVAGERRWRAARIAGLRQIPCIVRNFNEQENVIVAIIENMQREDLNPIEEAEGIQKLSEKYSLTQQEISKAIGKSRAYVANSLRLLKLPAYIQSYVSEGVISAAHARTLITVSDKKKQEMICNKIINEGLSVRATEMLAEKAKDEAMPDRHKGKKQRKSPEILFAEEEMKRHLATKVSIKGTRDSGKIEIEYYTLEELNRLLELIRSL